MTALVLSAPSIINMSELFSLPVKESQSIPFSEDRRLAGIEYISPSPATFSQNLIPRCWFSTAKKSNHAIVLVYNI